MKKYSYLTLNLLGTSANNDVFWHFFPNVWEFLVQILHAYYTFQLTLDFKFLFNYLQL